MPSSRHASFRLLAAGALLALLAACATSPRGPLPPSEARAERLLRQGNPAEAARMYEELANNNAPPLRNEFALAATRAWLDASRADDAQRALAIASVQLPAAQHFDRELLQVEINAARGQYQLAWQQASQLAEPPRAQDASRLFHLRQQVALRAGEIAAAVRAGIARERVATDEGGRNRARRDLLTDLRAAIDRGQRLDPAANEVALERGWLELAQIAASAGRSPLSARSMVDRWRQRFPGHPASTIIDSEILDPASRPQGGDARTARITGPVALLLPISDPDASVSVPAAQIRDGFQAYAAQAADGGIADVRIHDTAAVPIAEAIRAAAAQGATFIVGPLTRDDVLEATRARVADVPMLLLNTLPGGGAAGTWQYALAPEDEARQIARRIAGSGGRGVVVLTPGGDWGQRVAAAFADELTQAGGRVIAEGQYSTRGNTIEPTLTRALGIDASRARRDRVAAAIGTSVQFEVSPTPGIDAIFVAGYEPLALRQINPQLRFFNAGDIPTYITSQGIAVERAANRDLEGMRLVDMPWMLDNVGVANDARLATQHLWASSGAGQQPDPRLARFFAFGYDAGRVAAALRRGNVSWPLEGVTGKLSLAPDGRIERELDWAQVRDGAVQPADPFTP